MNICLPWYTKKFRSKKKNIIKAFHQYIKTLSQNKNNSPKIMHQNVSHSMFNAYSNLILESGKRNPYQIYPDE